MVAGWWVTVDFDSQYNIFRPGHLLFFPDSLSAHLNSMDHYHSITHFADYKVRSSLNRSKKNIGSLLLAGGKQNLTRQILSA